MNSFCELENVPVLNLDMISNLPENIIDTILVRLSLKDAVRTSILSSKWRFKWVTIPQLVFDKQCKPPQSTDKTLNTLKLVNIIDQVLLHHKGSIHKFRCSYYLHNCSDIDRWIIFLWRNEIKEFILDISGDEHYKVPSCLFLCREMSHLELYFCVFKPPSTFKGFCNLTTLDLQRVIITNNTLEWLISSCPVLERLILQNIDNITHLRIHAPNLRYSNLGGVFEVLCFENTSLLSTLIIDSHSAVTTSKYLEQGETCNLIKAHGSLHRLESLELCNYSLQVLALGDIPNRFPTTYDCLKKITLKINIANSKEISAALCLCKSSPKLQELVISVYSDAEATFGLVELVFWEAPEQLDCLFNYLKTVKMTEILGTTIDMKFIKLILTSAPVLETLYFQIAKNMVSEKLKIFEELLRFRRASPEAEIIYLS
ncbi:F-box/FBD/LRR-repeat protein At1g13570-like [Tasmannia lanceolata]|uniref:F-box/FBD/LRR-repeat protein At1g13570-like n=1 Tax=Tasmannia lanceolata TaxID=3420 RepID=UPI0040637809